MGYFLSLSKETNEHWLNASELTLLLCGLVLAYGAAGEYLDEHGKLPRWMRWTREPRLVFVWMVAISLFGEFAGDAGVYIFSGQLQTIADAELTQLKNENLKLQGQVGDAAANAQKAQDSADAASKAAGGAKEKADSVEGVANRALASEKVLEQENAALKAQMAPRRVGGAQAKLLCSGLHRVDPTTIDMESSMGTTEPDDFAGDIGRAIVACQVGLSVKLTPSVLIMPVPTPFRIAYGSKRKKDAEMISAAMVAAKIAAKPIELIPTPDNAPDALRFFVGPKILQP